MNLILIMFFVNSFFILSYFILPFPMRFAGGYS